MKYNFSEICIEITRRCNMKCNHCLRGPAQKLDIDLNYVSKLFDSVNYISSLTITGGEPSIVPELIDGIIEIAKKKKVNIGNFYIVTNAKKISDAFILAVMKLYLFCSDNEISAINYSIDNFHDSKNQNDINKLKLLTFAHERDNTNTNVLKQGRAKDWGYQTIRIDPIELEDEYIEGMIYLNCKGDVILGVCDASFINQDKISSGNIQDPNFNLVQAIENHNEQIDKIRETVYHL